MRIVSRQWSGVGKSIFGLALCAVLFAVCLSAEAQQSKKIPRIGILSSGSPSSKSADGLHQGLSELGYVDGKNISFEYRYADGDRSRLPTLASELVQLKVDVIVATGTQTAVAAKQATTTIPIVVGDAGDLVEAGIVASLARPGGNLTRPPPVAPAQVEILQARPEWRRT